MTPLNWPRVSTLSWRERNALVEAAARGYLANYKLELDTLDLAIRLYSRGPLTVQRGERRAMHPDIESLTKLLTRLAPHIGPPLATHDGVTVTRNGKTWRRWRWHGQRRES